LASTRDAVHLGTGAHVRCVGKGRKERCTPLTTVARDAPSRHGSRKPILKEAALAKLKPYKRSKRTRFQPNDRLPAFLEAL
jgi:site-specific recombinase XerD